MKIFELIESIARERCVEKEDVKRIIESILKQFAVEKYGKPDLIQVELSLNGSFEAFIERKVVANDEEFFGMSKISIDKAILRDRNAKVGSFVRETLPLQIGKVEIDKLFSMLKDKLNDLQKEREYYNFEGKVGTILVGYVKTADLREAVLSFPEGEGVLKKHDMLPQDSLRPGTYVKVYLKDLRKSKGNQILLSRTHENFLKELLKAEVPEIQDGDVEIKAVARDPGSLSKIAVHASKMTTMPPVKACIGPHGSRIQSVSEELLGEKISIIEWNEDIKTFISNALAPATVLKISENKNSRKFNVVLSNDQFSKAMGRGGQNVSLAKRLCKVTAIKLLTQEQESDLYKEKLSKTVEKFVSCLNIEEMMAHVLASNGLFTIDDLISCDLSKISEIDGFDEDLAAALQERAKEALEEEKVKVSENLKEAGYANTLFEVEGLTLAHVEHLIEAGVCEKNELAILDSGELKAIFNNNDDLYITFDEADFIIASARGINKRSHA